MKQAEDNNTSAPVLMYQDGLSMKQYGQFLQPVLIRKPDKKYTLKRWYLHLYLFSQ